ncbi:hypothetical protein Xkhy_20635 [Xanthomonas axonopodis pv. khayae]|uniref:Uncharacterized protein n=1 Tax=Xanthomonas campestris pv. malvacearum TaxID=86040 RepID=A0AA45BVY6_XANCM|nr:hypothetical protein BGK55_03225 [Xanthomonas citri pv. malvacearum]OOX06494.1 hypothetical protein Xkhy_20635 [Xanthomonas axonopodis pv. khayae]ASN02833.1 hypothetical protein APY29_19105 [Xanthomonas citri pv. malvacearum]ASN11035.1 hypothetical protein APY30_18920 [Xanthomonas citri pv. malvacearum]ASY86004.1 hypothetical protein CIW71_20475 [Xanthomonas citri pv. malvacearum]
MFGWEGPAAIHIAPQAGAGEWQSAAGRTEGVPVSAFDKSIREHEKRITGHAMRRPTASTAKTSHLAQRPTPPCIFPNAAAPVRLRSTEDASPSHYWQANDRRTQVSARTDCC